MVNPSTTSMPDRTMRPRTATSRSAKPTGSVSEMRKRFGKCTTSSLICVGPNETPHSIPQGLLTSVSPFFNAALTGTFAEGLSQTVKLPEDRNDVFEYFLYWLFTQRLDHEAVDAEEPLKPAFFWLLHLYVMADKFGIDTLKNQLIDRLAALAEQTNSVPTPTDTWIIWEAFPHPVPMKKLIVDLFAWKRTDNLLDNHEDEWHPRFMRDLLVKGKREGFGDGAPRPWTEGVTRMCFEYHEHHDDKKC